MVVVNLIFEQYVRGSSGKRMPLVREFGSFIAGSFQPSDWLNGWEATTELAFSLAEILRNKI